MLSIVHVFAKAYGWTRDYILDCVYIDEVNSLIEMIHEDTRQEYLIQSHIRLLTQMTDEARQDFLESLRGNDMNVIEGEVKTDFAAIEKAKIKLGMM